MYLKPIRWNASITGIIVILITFVLASCGNTKDLASEVSGKWQDEQGRETVEINLTQDSSSLTINGQTFTGIVENIDNGTNTIRVKVKTQNGNMELWSLHQIWNDNGSAFKLNLRHNGVTKTLIPVGRS